MCRCLIHIYVFDGNFVLIKHFTILHMAMNKLLEITPHISTITTDLNQNFLNEITLQLFIFSQYHYFLHISATLMYGIF